MNQKYLNLIMSLKTSPEIIGNYLLSISDDDMNIKRKENFWTIRQHLIHLLLTQKLLYDRILRFKNEVSPAIEPYFPENDKIDKDKDSSVPELIDKFKVMRNNQMILIESLDEKDFRKEAAHGEYKKYNLEIILNHMLFHDYWHMYRIEELWLTKDKYLSE